MLDNMQAAEQRRLEAQQAQRARLSAKSELVMSRLVRAGSICINYTAEKCCLYASCASVQESLLPGSTTLRASTSSTAAGDLSAMHSRTRRCCWPAFNILAVLQANCQAADKARRQQLLNQLLGRLANAEQQRQAACAQRGTGVAKRCSGSRPRRSSSSSGLKRLVAVRGLEDWMQVGRHGQSRVAGAVQSVARLPWPYGTRF
jgi:hypothetical protein